MKQTKQTIKDCNLVFEEKFIISMLSIIIAYIEGKYGKGQPVRRLTEDDLFSNAYYMFQRLKVNAKKASRK